jgi:HEPN domain-containing protein
MNKSLDIINYAVSLTIKAAVIAARFSGRSRKHSLRRLASMDINEKDKELLFLRDMVDPLKIQISILQNGMEKKQKNPRYSCINNNPEED